MIYPTFPKSVLAVAITCLILSAAPLHAATYYISPQGQDTNAGTSPDKPWQTIAKVNAATFMPGDQILFARGSEWRESLKASSSGAAGNPITFAGYGEEAKPKFWGSDVLKNADFKPFKGNTYICPITKPAAAVLVDHKFLLAGDMNAVLTKPDTWHFDGKNVYVNLGGRDPRTDGKVYTACVRVDCIHSNGKNHLIFRDLIGDESADVKDGYAFRVMGSDDVRLENCEAYRAGRHHFGTINSTHFVGKGLSCAYAMPNIPGGATFYVSFSDQSRSGDTHQWIDCSAEHLENPNQGNYQVFYNHGEGLGPILIQNMKSDGGKFSFGSSAKAPVTIKGGSIKDNSLEIFGSHARVDGLTIQGNGSVDCFGSDCIFQNMQLVNIKPKNGGPTGYWSAIVLRDKAKGNVFRFCTIVIDPTATGPTTCLAFVGKESATQCYGNIMVGNPNIIKCWAGKLDAKNLAKTDYNLYGDKAQFVSSEEKGMDFKTWQGQGFDAHSLQGDPLFVNPAEGNFALKEGSPARAAAKVEAGLRPETDVAGKPRKGAACDIGANESSRGAGK